MKGLEELMEEVLIKREKLEKEQQEIAKNILFSAISFFEDIRVETVTIEIGDGTNEDIAIYSNEEKRTGFEDLEYVGNVFDILSDFLSSEDCEINPYFHINVDNTCILLKLKE